LRDFCVIEPPNVVADRQIRPVLRKYLTAEGLDFTVEIQLEPRPLQTKVQSSDPGEK
jgi:hypothetical protein